MLRLGSAAEEVVGDVELREAGAQRLGESDGVLGAGRVVRLAPGRRPEALVAAGACPGEFGEAHMIAVNDKDEIYVADSVNGAGPTA